MSSVGSVAHAQTVTGRVLDAADGMPLVGAHVLLDELAHGTVTDADGAFRLTSLSPDTYRLQVQYIGYASATRTITLAAGQSVTITVELQPTQLSIDEVVVRAGRTTEALLTRARQSVATLPPDVLNRTRGQTLGETLKQLPGVTTMQTGPSISKPVVRGLHSQRVVVLNHGVPQEGQQWGGEHAPEIDPFAPARIEVVKGAAGVEHGVGAIGGVIRVEPRALPSEPGVGGTLALNGFSNSRQGAGSLLLEGMPTAAPQWGWRVQGSVRKAGDAHTPDYVIGNSAFEERSGNLALGYRTERSAVELYASRFTTDLGIYRGSHISTLRDLRRAIGRERPLVAYSFSYGIDAPKQSITHDLLTLKGIHRLSNSDQLELQYGVQRNHRQEFDAHRRGGDPLDEAAFDLTLNTHTLDLKWRLAPRGTAFGVVGLSGMNQGNVNAETGYLIPNFRALTGGAFAHGTWLRGDWTWEAGTRADVRWMKAYPRSEGQFARRTHDYASLSGVIGGIWQMASTWSLAANAATAWRPPSVNELYSYGVHHGTAQFEIGDTGLASERTLSLDVTLRHISEHVRLEASGYANRMSGFIHSFPTRDTLVTIRGVFPAFQYQQADALLRGVDGQVEVDVQPWLALGATASLVRGTNTEADIPLIGMPSDRLTLHSTICLFEGRRLTTSTLRPELTLVRKQTHVPEGVDYAPPPDGYALVGLHYNADLQVGSTPLQLGVSIHNLFNTRYRDYLSRWRYFIDEPGRTVVLRLSVPFGTAASGSS
jgi:iron complex outermembrane receptor protein